MIDQIPLQIPSPLQKIEFQLFREHGLSVYVKREDLIHPSISGNKWRKLKYNLIRAMEEKAKKIITFGGAFSNHIYATAAACQALHLPLVVYIRSDRIDSNNPTLNFIISKGAEIRLLSREDYRQKNSEAFLQKVKEEFPKGYIIPEGGSNTLALRGMYELGDELNKQIDFTMDYLAVSAGTGSTAAGLIGSISEHTKIEVYSSLKGDFLIKDINEITGKVFGNWSLKQDYHFGGYGKTPIPLIEFINDFKQSTGIPLDPIYTGKAMFGLLDRIGKGLYKSGSKIVFVHTGGLQGILGYNYLNKENFII